MQLNATIGARFRIALAGATFATAIGGVACSPPSGGDGGAPAAPTPVADGATVIEAGPSDAGAEAGIPPAVDLECSQWGRAREWESFGVFPEEFSPATRSFSLQIIDLVWHSKLAAQGANGDAGYGIGWLPRGLLGTRVVDPAQILAPKTWGTTAVPTGPKVYLVLDGMTYVTFTQVTGSLEDAAAVQPASGRTVYVSAEPVMKYLAMLYNEGGVWTYRARFKHVRAAATTFNANGSPTGVTDLDGATTTVSYNASDITIRDDFRSLSIKHVFAGGLPPVGLVSRIEGPTDYGSSQIDVHLGTDYMFDAGRHLTGTKEPRTFGQQAAKLTYTGDMIATYTSTTAPSGAYPTTPAMSAYAKARPTNGVPPSTLTIAPNGDFQSFRLWNGGGYSSDYGTPNAVGVIGPFNRFLGGGAFNGCTLVGARDSTATDYRVTRTSGAFLKEILNLRTGQPVVRYDTPSGAEGDAPAQPNPAYTIERRVVTTVGNGITTTRVEGYDALRRETYSFDGDVTRLTRYHDVDPSSAADGWADGQPERELVCHNDGGTDCFSFGAQTNDAWLAQPHPAPGDAGGPDSCIGIAGASEEITLRSFKRWNGTNDRSVLLIECHKSVTPTSGSAEPKYTISRSSADGKQQMLLMSNWDPVHTYTYGTHNQIVTEQKYNWNPNENGATGSLQTPVGGEQYEFDDGPPGSRFYGRVWRKREFATTPAEPIAKTVSLTTSGLMNVGAQYGLGFLFGGTQDQGPWPWPQDPSTITQRFREWHNDWHPIGVWQNSEQVFYGINGTDRRSHRIYDVNILPTEGPGVQAGWVTILNNERKSMSVRGGEVTFLGYPVVSKSIKSGQALRNYVRINPGAGWSP